MTDVFGAEFLDRLHSAGAVKDQASFEALRTSGFPNRRVEAWRYTDLAAQLAQTLTPAGLRINQEQSGLFGPIPSVEPVDGDALSLLNAAVGGEGFLFEVPAGAKLKPTFARFGAMAENALVNATNKITVGEGGEAVLVERWGNVDDSWINSDTTVELAANAKLTRIILVEDGAEGTQTHRTFTALGENARYDALVVTLGGGLHRIEQHADINASGAHAGLAALVLKRNKEHSDFVTNVRHLAADTTSDQQVRTVVDGDAKQNVGATFAIVEDLRASAPRVHSGWSKRAKHGQGFGVRYMNRGESRAEVTKMFKIGMKVKARRKGPGGAATTSPPSMTSTRVGAPRRCQAPG